MLTFLTVNNPKGPRNKNAANTNTQEITVTTRKPTNDELKAIADDGGQKKTRRTRAKARFLVRLPDGSYVGSPDDIRTANPQLAGVFEDGQAQAKASAVGGTVVPLDEVVTKVLPPSTPKAKAQRKAKAATKEAPRSAGKVSFEEVSAMLVRTGLVVTRKSSDHWHAPGAPKGPRLVLPRGKAVTRLYCYKLTDPRSPGFKTEEERRAKRLGQVTNVVDVATMADVEAALLAVVEAVDPPLKATKPRVRKARGGKEAAGGQA